MLAVGRAREHDDREAAQLAAAAQFLQELVAVHARHVEVQDDEVWAAALELLQRRAAVAGLHDPVGVAGELARRVGNPKASRAVGQREAVVLVPQHFEGFDRLRAPLEQGVHPPAELSERIALHIPPNRLTSA